MENEKEYLNFVIKYISDMLDEELSTFDELQFKYRRDPDHYGVAYKIACDSIKKLKSGVIKPYFARIDFKDDNRDSKEKIYIGKYGLYDKKNNPVVIDWRAPIANLYYDSEVGRTSYLSPDGNITGELTLKRQFEIEDGVLLDYHDVDIVSNDQLLQKYLQVNNDMRLKNIVSTIQQEQNYAIRKPLNTNLIIQGVAGSGKTTIALHRIAYLVYNYRNTIKNNQYMVIGPNNVFLKYIKSVLPDLDVSDVTQETYESIAKEIIDENINIKQSAKVLNLYLSGKINSNIPKFKNSDEYRIMLDLFLDNYFEHIIEDDLKIQDFVILEKKFIKKVFAKALKESENFNGAVDRFVLLINEYTKNNATDIISKLDRKTYEKLNAEIDEMKKNEIRKKRKIIYDEINKGCKQSARKCITKNNLTATKIYRQFINDIQHFDVDNYNYIDELKKQTLENIKTLNFDFEDLAALLHIKSRLGVDKVFKNYKHVVIDEAQDLGKFNFYALKECLPNATFSIYGDITQSIYDYRSIDSWDDIKDIFENCEEIDFKKSYRTTDEIMEIANSVSEYLNLGKSELSIRHGKQVSFSHMDSSDIPKYIKNKISEYKEKGYQTVAVISKYPTQSNYINDDLSFEGLIIPNINENTDLSNLENGVFTIPNYLAKGLEFDAVIINDASENVYKSDENLDMKMLYVALTRALHEMDVIYTKELTRPLSKFVEKEKVIKKIR